MKRTEIMVKPANMQHRYLNIDGTFSAISSSKYDRSLLITINAFLSPGFIKAIDTKFKKKALMPYAHIFSPDTLPLC